MLPITCRDNVWFFHADKKQATAQSPIVFSGAGKPVAVTLMRTGDPLPYEFDGTVLKITIPEKLKAGNVTDVVIVEFGDNFNYEPYMFTHWK